MVAAVQKITLSSSRDIPFNKLLLSQSNVRRVKAGVSIEELAEDIARRGLLQGLSVRAVTNEAGDETGRFEIPAGGRRFRALELLVKQKRLAKTAAVPCIVREAGIAEEDSLAENVQRAPLHPLDQFRAFLVLREKGQSEEEIAAAFFVPISVVKQRLKLASVSPKLLDIYAEDGLTLDQLMAFTVSADHERQEQVHERLTQAYDTQPYMIRRMLTEQTVRASDKRALFVGVDAYVEAGGCVLRDLFQADDGGWLQDAALLDLIVAEKLRDAAAEVQAEGWKWTEIAPSFPYGHAFGLRQLRGEQAPPTHEEEASRSALQAELDRLEAEHADADELPEEVDARLGEIETALEAIDGRPVQFDAGEIGRAGAFISIDGGGSLRIERGFIRPEDELPAAPEVEGATGEVASEGQEPDDIIPAGQSDGVIAPTAPSDEPEEDEGLKPLPDRLIAELTAHRTVALRHVLGEHLDIAFLAALHALCVRLFYHYGLDTCLELDVKSVSFAAQAPGLADTPSALALAARHQTWREALPSEPEELWDALNALDANQRQALFAHCVALSVNAVIEPYNRRPRAIAHADRLAQAVDLDMADAGWMPTVDAFLGRVTKARILAAVREAKDDPAAERIAHMKKGEMADAAEQLLAGTGWLPEPLRTPSRSIVTATAQEGESAEIIDFASAPIEVTDEIAVGEDDEVEGEDAWSDVDEPHAIAAE